MSPLPTPRAKALPALAFLAASALLLTACADTAESTAPAADSIFPSDLTDAALSKAEEIVGDEDLGGTVTMIGTLGGAERERYLATLAPFEEASGVTIEYTGTEDYEALIQSGLESGNPIDVAQAGNTGIVSKYAGTGDIYDLNEIIGADELSEAFAPAFLDSTTHDGANYGLWTMVDNYEIWYNPAQYDGPTGTDVTWDELTAYTDEQQAAGIAPWCMGLSAGPATGWPGAYFVLNILLKQAGPDFVTALGTGEASWDSPEVRAAFETFSEVVASDETVFGGPDGAITTDPGAAGTGMYTDPQQCSLMHWGTFTASIILSSDESLEPITDLDFMPMPAIDPEYADVQGYGGTVVSIFSDRPEVVALAKYLASAESSNLIAATGNWTGTNAGISSDSYPNDILAKVSDELLNGSTLVPFPIAVTPAAVTSTVYRTVAEFVQDPASLDANLAAIDAAQASAQ
jgi:alpha-glucoside transport system substrate-binding protein